MSAPVAFGRRTSAAPAARPRPASELGAAAQAFREDLSAARSEDAGFAAWKRAQTGRRLLAWALSFALLTPGVVCFVVQAPVTVSAGLEVGGIVLGVWLRRERRRHLAAIRDWGEGEGVGGT